jgi:hypothetical protein
MPYHLIATTTIDIIKSSKKTAHPDDLPKLCLNVNPGIPLLAEKPFVLKEPALVRKLGVIPDLLMFKPRPLPRLIRFENLKPIVNL